MSPILTGNDQLKDDIFWIRFNASIPLEFGLERSSSMILREDFRIIPSLTLAEDP